MIKTTLYSIFEEKMIYMALAQATKSRETTYTLDDAMDVLLSKLDDAMDVLLSKLDEAIDDMENGRVQTIEEAWEEIDTL